jgi:glycosyltransferase involved in cell wall biosynthesis
MDLAVGSRFVSVVIPCLDEADAIGGVVAEVREAGADEIVVVDNGSADDTSARARAAGAVVVAQPQRGYGRACAAGLAAISARCDVVCFLDGDGSDVPSFLAAIVGPVAADAADFVIGSRLLGRREKGSMTPQQLVAGRIAGVLIRLFYRVRMTDMSPFRAAKPAALRSLGLAEATYGWNLEMQMKVAAAGWRILEIPVDHRCRRGGVSKVSGDLVAGLNAAWVITKTFVRLAASLRHQAAPARHARR